LENTPRSPSVEHATNPSVPSRLKNASPTAVSGSLPGPGPATTVPLARTEWSIVFLSIFAGILAATQVGKAHIALPAIRSDLALSLEAGSWLISAMNFLGLF
jgi:hypothetical protein